MITIIAEPSKKAGSQEKLVSIFRKLKEANKELEINLKIAKRTDSMRGYRPKDEEVLIIFGAKLYQHVLRDINEFDKMAGNSQRDVHKFSYFVRRDKKHYFIACMPPIDLTMTKPDSFLAFESFMKTLMSITQNFKISIRDAYLNKSLLARREWPIDVVENGFSPKTKLYMNYNDVKAYLYSLFDLPAYSLVAIDTETNGLEIWDESKHDLRIMSFANEDNLGHAINLSLPGLTGCYQNGQVQEIRDLVEKYIFEKHKTFVAWNCGFDIFAICNLFNRSYRDFIKVNKILDGMQLLHVLCENRKIEGYNLKAAARDLLNFPQYSFVQKYLDYLKEWQTYSPDKIIESATNSLTYAAEDAAGEYALTTRIKRELDENPISFQHVNAISPKIMAVKLETEWNGFTIDIEGMVKNSLVFGGWELDNIVKPVLKKCQDASDGRLHAEMFVFSTVTGRLLYGKPYLNGMKIGSKASEYFVADPGHTLVYVDLDSADLRSAALVAQEKTLISDLNDEGDYYIKFAKELFGDIEITDKERNVAKLFILSMLNYAGDTTIAKETGVSVGDVKAYKEKFYNRYPRMRTYQVYLQTFLRQNNYVFSPTWRMRRFSEDDLDPATNQWKSILSAQNFPFQSTTADLMVVNCFSFLGKTREYGVKQCLLNVDAAIFNVPDEHLDTVKDKFSIFEEVHSDIIRGAKYFQEKVFFDLAESNLPIVIPQFTYKLYRGKNLKDMEKW
jgi:DNA polymerase I-like protein with 3'-5' exonuclease and polymerase domains